MDNNAVEKEIIAAAADAGNNMIKIIVNNKPYLINSVALKAYESRLVFGQGDKGESGDYLDVDIDINGMKGNYYFGNLALSKGGSSESLGGDKSSNDLIISCMIVSLAYAMHMEYPEQSEYHIRLGSGLPVQEFFSKNNGNYTFEKVNIYREKLLGTHKVNFNSTLFNKKNVTLVIEEVIPMPECYAALYKLLFDEQGNSKFPQLTKKNMNILGLDLGGGSSDVSGICNGQYIEKAMFGINMGINKALDKTSETVKNKANIPSFTRYDLNSYLFDSELKGILETNKGSFDLNSEKLPYYQVDAESIVKELKKKLATNELGLNMIHGLFLLGGASREFGDIIINELKQDIPNIIKASDHVEDPRLLNVQAYYDAALGIK